MVKFKKALIEGFGSFVLPTKFKFDREGLNIIIAHNGAGKTTTFNALYWVLFGKSLKGKSTIETWENLRTEEWKGTKVELKFEAQNKKYLVIRCKEYRGQVEGSLGKNRLVLLEDGKEVTLRDKGDIQKYLESLIGFSPELFKNSILFGQRLKRIIQETGPEKKKIFEEAFDSGFIQKAYDKAKKELDLVTKEKDSSEKEYLVNKTKYLAKKDEYLNLKVASEEFEDKKQRDIKSLDKANINLLDSIEKLHNKHPEKNVKAWGIKIQKIKDEIAQLKSKSDLHKAWENSEFKQSNLVDKLESELGQLINIRKEAKLNSMKFSKECQVCGAKLSANKIKDIHSNYLKEVDVYSEKIVKKEVEIQAEKKELKDLRTKIASITDNSKKINELGELQQKLAIDIIKAQTDTQSLSVLLMQHRLNIETIEKLNHQEFTGNIKKVRKELKTLKLSYLESRTIYLKFKKSWEDLKWVISGPLGNKGIRAYIFDTMIALLNERLKYYEQFIKYRVEFGVDLESGNKDLYAVVYQGDQVIYYEDLSGGQQQLVDICAAFGIYDLVSEEKACNVLLFDEVFEGLDINNVELVSELIRDKANGKSLFLITHNTDLHNQSTKIIRMRLNDKGQTETKLL